MLVHLRENGATVLLVALLAAVGYAVYRTGPTAGVLPAPGRTSANRSVDVDQSSLITAEQLLRLPTTADERPFAEDVLRLADKEMDLAFAQAVRQAANRPPVMTPEVKATNARLQQALQSLEADQAQVSSLTAAAARATPTTAPSINDQLNLAKAQAALDQDEVDDAKDDLQRSGGDPQGRMNAMIAEHDAASRSSDSIRVTVTAPAGVRGLVRHLEAWQALGDKATAVRGAKALADSLAIVFKTRHDRMEQRAARRRDSSAISHDSSAALLAATQRQAREAKTKATLDQRVDNQHKLSDDYTGWLAVVAGQQRAALNRVLRDVGVILTIVLAGLLLTRWLERAIGATSMERRRAQTLFMIVRVSIQVIAVLLILLVLFGPPDNLGTFLGLAGAGLTVALKDFLIAFIGWFVLMSRNGIRIGDLVEINGVTGEVVELGMFYTVLLETGSWNEAGHPTGRRVTFTNSYAIEGHYFNFSTSGQWLWDEVRIHVPAGRDPHPIVEAIKREVDEATADSARQAEAEWQTARAAPRLSALTAAPSISVKPVSGGVEIAARYITRASERAALRGRLYQTAVDLLGGAMTAAPTEG